MLEIWLFTFVLTCSLLAILFFAVRAHFRRATRATELDVLHVRLIAERVRPVGRLVGLEVVAKEIATATAGVSWLPPVLMSQARIAMIFHFEKQYSVDLSAVGPEDVRELTTGEIELNLRGVEGTLRLLDVVPYDIQDGRIFGLLDVVPMNAQRQTNLMAQAQQQASELFRTADAKYVEQARRSIERQLASILALGGTRLIIRWQDEAPDLAALRDRAQVLASEPDQARIMGAGRTPALAG
jgi:hypothetical protein